MCYIFSSFSKDKFGYVKDLIGKCDYTYFLIGGAGNGKSTILRKIGEFFSEKKVDYLYCSYDVSSLDGLLINDKILVFDSSYPHNLLPTLHKVDGEIVDIAGSIDGGIIAEKAKLNELYDEESYWKNLFQSYGETLSEFINAEVELIEKTNCCRLKKQIDIFVNSVKLFDNDGIIADAYHKQEYFGNKKKYSFCHSNKTLAELALNEAATRLDKKNISMTKYHNVYCDKLIEGIETKNAYLGVNLLDAEQIDICENCEEDEFDWCDIMQKIRRCQTEAVAMHKRLERCYKPYIDFDINRKIVENLIDKIDLKLNKKT